MVVETPQKRSSRRYIPAFVFFIYGLVALLIVLVTGLYIATPALAADAESNPDNPLSVPLCVLQVLFTVTAISGLASIIRWIVGVLAVIGRLCSRR